MRFVVRLHSFACTLPTSPSSTSPARPYLRLNFDGYKKFSTKPLPSALTAASAALVFPEAYTFQYETSYPQKLHQKQLTVKLYSHNTILADTLLGQTHITLHTIATGPIVHDLPLLREAGKEAGRVRLTVEMEQLVAMTMHLQSVSLSSLPTIQGKAPVSHLSYGYTGLDSKRLKTDKLSNTVTPEWSGAALHPVKFHTASVKELWREGLELDVLVKRRRGEKSHKCGSVLVRLANHHSFVEKGGLSVVERLQPTPDYAQLQCMVRLHFYYEGVPSYVQMSKGRHDEKGVHDGQPFAEGLPLPTTQFYKTSMQPPPAAAVNAPAPASVTAAAAAAVAPGGAAVRRGSAPVGAVRARGDRERSVMSIRAAREYDGASIVRSSYNYRSDEEDDEDIGSPQPQPAPHRLPPRAASVLGTVDSTASAPSGSRGMSRSSSSGSIAASAANSGSRTPNSQKRYLAYPPPPPPKPEQLKQHVKALSGAIEQAAPGGPPGGAVGGRGVSFDSQARDLTPTSQRGRDSVLSSPVPPAASMSPLPGVTGYCAMCGRPSNQFCNETLQPVCSHSCTAKALHTAGLPLPFMDEEKQRPPPLNPSVYPLLSPSVSHRQPGPAGFCVICQHPALYLCKDTLVPVCSAECKVVHLKLNPHLKGGRGGGGPEATAPFAPSRSAVHEVVAGGGGQPSCVVCGRRAEFRCSVSNDSVCGVECKQVNLARTARRAPRVSPTPSPTPPSPSPAASAGVSCPACTYVNARGASACEMCGGLLSSAAAGGNSGAMSPRAPVYHLFQGAPVHSAKRPSFAAVGASDSRAGPGGPAARGR